MKKDDYFLQKGEGEGKKLGFISFYIRLGFRCPCQI